MNEINWNTKPPFVINPQKKKEAKKTIKIAFALFAIGYGVWFTSDAVLTPKIKAAEERVQNDQIKTDMNHMADEGKVSAILWLASNYPDRKYRAELDKLIDQNNSEAMLIKARLLWETDENSARALIKDAAQEGNPEAVKYLTTTKTTDIGFKKFVSDYLFK